MNPKAYNAVFDPEKWALRDKTEVFQSNFPLITKY